MADTLDTQTPGSPGWWLTRLNGRLQEYLPKFNLLDRYDTGEHPLPEGDDRAREMFRKFQRKARSNYTGLVAESVLERMQVVGFRTGGAGTDEADTEAWRIWQANHLDADSDLVHRASLVFSTSYVIVGPNPDDPRTPIITPEDPREVIAEVDPRDRRTVRAALKTYTDDVVGGQVAVVYLPAAVHYFVKDSKGWQSYTDPRVGAPAAENPFGGVVPVVPFANRPRVRGQQDKLLNIPGVIGDAMSEFAGIIDIQDRINNVILDRLVISKMQAYRQRWAKGIKVEDENGEPLDLPFVPGVDLLWAVEDETASFGDFAATDLEPILRAAEADIRDLAAISRTPPHYLLGSIVNASGEALAAAETGLVAKAKQRIRHASESWERVMALAGIAAGRLELSAPDTETLWRDPEHRTMAELADAAVKKAAAGVPWRQRMLDMGYTPQEVDRMDVERTKEMLLQPQPQQSNLVPTIQHFAGQSSPGDG